MPTRRFFVKSSALAMFGTGAAPAWLGRALYAADAPNPRKKVLVAILQRGAMDGLNAVVPHGEKAYYDLRPTISIPRPTGTQDSAIDLDGFFGLHPSLRALKPIYDAGSLAIVHAAGSPDPTRSHFDAQDYMESGTPGLKSTGDGWLNRALLPQTPLSPVRAISLSTDLPHALRGSNEAVAISSLSDFRIQDTIGSSAFEHMYTGTRDQILNATGRETFEAIKRVEAVENASYAPSGNVRYPPSKLGQNLMLIARLIKADVGLEVAFTDIGGWDHHFNEVGPRPNVGQLASLLSELGQSMAAFHADLGDKLADVCLVTMSEFGRTARENGSRGTDHGHGNVMFVLGGSIKGGKVYGDWPGLEREQLYEQRDLNVTTDFRDVLGELVTHRLGTQQVSRVFPGFDQPRFRGLVKG